MSEVKTVVCLANSRKPHGRCVAGIELVDDEPIGWIRPVSARSSHEVSEYERQYEDGSDPAVLDIIRIPLVESQPSVFQRENWLLDDERYWKKLGVATWQDLELCEDPREALWINGYQTYNGINDRVPSEEAASLTNSLRLIRVDDVTYYVHAPGEAFGNPKRVVQARFLYDGKHYGLRVTDPTYESKYLAQANGMYEGGESYLTVSLGEEYQGFAYKLVAAVLERAELE